MRRQNREVQGRFHSRDRTLFIKRKCLRCGNIFKSEWIGNRICAPCQLTNNKHK